MMGHDSDGRKLYLQMCNGILEALLENSPPVDILRVDAAILECLRDTAHLINPKLVHIDVASSDFVYDDVHLIE